MCSLSVHPVTAIELAPVTAAEQKPNNAQRRSNFRNPSFEFARHCAFEHGPGVAGENLSHTSHDRLSKMENKNQERLTATDSRGKIFFFTYLSEETSIPVIVFR